MKRIGTILLMVAYMATFGSTLMEAKSIDANKVESYLNGIETAKKKVKAFKKALVSRDPVKIKRATLAIQEDPLAVKELNKENVFVKKKFVNTTQAIHDKTLEGIKQRVAEKYHVNPADVEIETFTNPSETVKAGHDWDVTVKVKGKEVNFREVKHIVHESYYEAAGGKKAYPNESPKHFSERHNVEVTSSHNAEAYEGGKKYIENPKEYQVKDPERLSKTIEHKSHLEGESAAEYASKGQMSKSEAHRHEQARQYTKQYEKHIKPRVQRMGGEIPENVKKGTKILEKIGKFDKKLGRIYTPADADVDLAKLGRHGETMESIIQKGSSLVESGQKMKTSPQKTKLRQAKRDLARAQKSGNQKKVRKLKNKIARIETELKNSSVKEPAGKVPSEKVTGKSSVDALSSEEGVLAQGEKSRGKVPKEKVSGKISGGAAASEEGLMAKGKKMGGKIIENLGAGTVIFNTAEDVKESLQGKKSWKETGKNIADLAAGGAISVTEQTLKKNEDFSEMKQAHDSAQQSENDLYILKTGKDLRQSGVSKEETDKIMDAMRKGNNSLLYTKVHELRKEGKMIPLRVPRHVKMDGADDTVLERAGEVGKGLYEYGKRAGKFVSQTGKDLHEIESSSREILSRTVDTYNKNREAERKYKVVEAKLIAKGIPPEKVKAAIERYKEGHKESLRRLIKYVHQQDQEKGRKEKEAALAEEEKAALQKKAKALLERSKKYDSEAEAARARLRAKLEKIKQEGLPDTSARPKKKKPQISQKEKTAQKVPYREMTPEQKHEALKRNSDEAWEGLKKALLGEDNSVGGVIRGSWSGAGTIKGTKIHMSSSGHFKMRITQSGKISGSYWGDDKGHLSGHVNSNGKIKIHSGGGSAGKGGWSGSIHRENGKLVGRGRWHVDGFSGSWHGSGK